MKIALLCMHMSKEAWFGQIPFLYGKS